jgi:DNA gyrase/topoisomerase IV subunit A
MTKSTKTLKVSKISKTSAPTPDKHAVTVSSGALIKENMIIYGEDVIEDRAVPDFRDGLKPVQRRILYMMKNDLNLSHTGATKKCAAIVGGALGSYHPHGDSSVYQALVKLYHQRYRLIMPRGNFGSELETESAYRYTEAKFTCLQEDIFADINVMERVPNFDSSTTEPLVINTRIPLMLLNGASGIAVGLSVDIPSHNIKEVVEALIHVAKNPKTTTVADIVGLIPGPDFRNGGTMLSKQEAVASLYETGKGMLEFRCDYKLGQDSEGRTTIDVIGFPDEVFSVAGFINACGKLKESGQVYSVETDYIDSRFNEKSIDNKPLRTHTVKITVSNRKGLEAVMKKLVVRKTYQFYTTVRSPEGISLKTYNMLTILKKWVSWRKGEEKKVLELELSKAEKSLWNETTRLIAMQPKSIDIIADAAKQNKIPFEEYLVKHLKVTPEQAKFIGEIQTKNLSKANIPAQEQKIADIKKTIERIKDDLLHITRVVIKHLKALSVYFDERRTKVGGKAHNTDRIKVERTGDPTVMMASSDGKLFTNVTEKGTTSLDTMAVASYEGCIVFDATGLTKLLSTTECEGKAGPAYSKIVGVAPQEASHIIGIGKNGFCVKTTAQQRRSEFQLIKSTELIYGNALNDTSKVLVWGRSEEEFAYIPGSKISETRSNVAGKKLVNFKPKKALILHEGQKLCSSDGSSVSPQKAEEYYKDKLYVLDSRNIVFLKSGKRKFMDATQTSKCLASKDAKSVYPVTIPK